MKFYEICALEAVDHEEHIQIDPPMREVSCEKIAADVDIQEFKRGFHIIARVDAIVWKQ